MTKISICSELSPMISLLKIPKQLQSFETKN